MENKQCNIIIENRKKISISAVTDVDSFDEENIVLVTEEGALIIKGSDFHINKLNIETGEVIIEGYFANCEFDEKYSGKTKGNMWSKIFK